MSIRTVNVGMLPDDFEDFLIGFFVEAPPFYTGVRIKVDLSGGRTKTTGSVTIDETLSYSNEKTFTRIPMERDSDETWITTSSLVSENDINEKNRSMIPISADECRIVMLTFGMAETFRSRQISKAPLEIRMLTEVDEICGSWVYTDTADPTNDDSGDIRTGFFGWPTLLFDTPAGDALRTPMTKWVPSFSSFTVAPSQFLGTTLEDGDRFLDVSGWNDLQWRSKLGINNVSYGETHLDPDVTSTVLVEVEWELLT